jgi:mannose-1-phosphate guanylyltransferase
MATAGDSRMYMHIIRGDDVDRELPGVLCCPQDTPSPRLFPETAPSSHAQLSEPEAHLWGIILAGGDGTRLQPFVRTCFGSNRPKQYCTFFGDRSLLQQTLDRAVQLMPRERVITVITRHHLPYAREQLCDSPAETVLMQPCNRGTGAGILLPLLHIFQRDPTALVSIFPSDHFILEEAQFMRAVAAAVSCLSAHPFHMILLGVEPEGPEKDYGWIQAGPLLEQVQGMLLYQVENFWEKPAPWCAQLLYLQRHLWNTMVLVGRVNLLLELFQSYTPTLYAPLWSYLEATHATRQWQILQEVYAMLPTINFSQAILSQSTTYLRVLRVSGVHWSDWGMPHRVAHDLAYYELT